MSANLYHLLMRHAGPLSDKAFLVEANRADLSFGELDFTARRLAAKLRAHAKPGDRLLVQAEKSPEAVALYLASLAAGLIYVPLNTAYTTAEVAYFAGDSEPAILVCAEANRDAYGALAPIPLFTLNPDGSGDLLQDLPAEPLAVEPRENDDLAAILYTSGTTGRSKGAMLSHRNLAANALALQQAWHWSEQDVLLHALPIYHIHGLFVAVQGALIAGATMLFHRRFDPKALLADLPRATMLMGVPTFYTRLLDQPGLTRESCASIRLFVCGSAPLLESTFSAFQQRTGHTILERYGMTEAGMIASNPYEGERLPGTVGYALPGVEARLGGEVLEVRGESLFQGYWRNPQKTAEEFRPDGFFITGDIATIAEDGRISIAGRAKDLIISGGLNIYPKEIELLIDAVPGVGESAVIGAPHPDFGEAVVAVVTGTAMPEDIMEFVSAKLARFKQPKHIAVANELPRNAMGKVQKAELRKTYEGIFRK